MAAERLEQLVSRVLERYGISKDIPMVLGLSGGRDSTALLFILKKLGYQVVVAHVNYGLRDAARGDQLFCEEMCRHSGIAFQVLSATSKLHTHSGEGTQALARRIRYTWFKELARETGSQAILTAHHAGDVLETWLLNTLRGNAHRTPSGIPEKSGLILRPLLQAPSEWISAYMNHYQIPWREDHTNALPLYLRNRIRHELLPVMEEIYPGAGRKLRARADAARQRLQGEHAVLKSLIGEIRPERIQLPAPPSDAPAVQKWIIERWADHFKPDQQRVRVLLKLLHSPVGSRLSVQERETWYREEHALVRVLQPAVWHPFNIDSPGSGCFETVDFQCTWQLLNGTYIPELIGFQMDVSKICWPITVRPWQPGDRIRMLGAQGSRKVSDILTDLGIRQPAKRNFAVLEDQKGLIAVMGGRIAARVAVQPQKQHIFHFRIDIAHA